MTEHSISEGATWGDPIVVAGRAWFFAEFLFMEEIYGPNAPAYIANYCQKARVRLKAYADKAQARYAKNQRALVHLAGKVKYVLAHIELAECYGKHLGIMTENHLFRQHALAFISLVQAENEVLEHFHYDG